MAPQRVIGVDLGGTKILAGIVDRDGTVDRRREVPTPLESQDELLRGLAGAVEDVLEHMVIDLDGPPCQGACTGRGHLEALASGHAATMAAKEQFGPAVDAHRLVRLANEGDDAAVALLAEFGHRLGAGIASLVNIFNPELVVIGGGFSAAGDFLFEPARDRLARGG